MGVFSRRFNLQLAAKGAARLILIAVILSVVLTQALWAGDYWFRSIYGTTFGAPNPAGDPVLSPAINNLGDILWAGQTQGGPRIYLNGPERNLAGLAANADTLVDSRLARSAANTDNAVWNASTGEIDPLTKTAAPGSGYQEDRIYLYDESLGSAPRLIGVTRFGVAFSTLTSPDVNDAGQAVFRRLHFPTTTFALSFHDGSGAVSGTREVLTGYNSINTTFINNAGVAAFFGRARASDPLSLHLYDGNSGDLVIRPVTFANLTLRDFSDDGTGLAFAGASANGTMYAVESSGTALPLFTAGTQWLSRVELGQRNRFGQVAFANRTVLASGGSLPAAGQSDVMVFADGGIERVTDHPAGTAVSAANLNDDGEIVYVTTRFLYDANGAYTGLREFQLTKATPFPENLAWQLYQETGNVAIPQPDHRILLKDLENLLDKLLRARVLVDSGVDGASRGSRGRYNAGTQELRQFDRRLAMLAQSGEVGAGVADRLALLSVRVQRQIANIAEEIGGE